MVVKRFHHMCIVSGFDGQAARELKRAKVQKVKDCIVVAGVWFGLFCVGLVFAALVLGV